MLAALSLTALLAAIPAHVEPDPVPLEAALRERCEQVLRAGVKSDEFWPAIHAAETLTLAGHGKEVLESLAKRPAADDQQRCGLAREAVRAGDRTKLPVLLAILAKPGSNGHTHAAESLFKVAEVGDGTKLRAALAQTDNLKLKLMAAAALARCGHPAALDVVRKYLDHKELDARKSAVWILGQLGAASDIERIQACRKRETDVLTRAYCDHALALLGDADGRKALGANLTATDAAVKTYAAEFAGHCRATEFRTQLVKLLDDPTLDVRVRAAQALIMLARPAHKRAEIIVKDVFPATEKNPRYSEGSVAVLADGALLHATTEFSGAADYAKARIVARASRDAGYTWGEPRVLQDNVGKQNVMSVTLRRLKPGAVAGPLGLFYLVKNGPTDLKAYLRASNDEAKTFGAPVCVTDAPGYHVVNNDRVTVLSTGRILVPVAWSADVSKGGHFTCFCYYSDNEGKTWKKGAGSVDLPKRGAMEPEVIELSDELLMIIRTQLGYIATARSKDRGEHWEKPGKLSLEAPEAPATIRRIPATGDLLIIWNKTHDPKAGHGGKRTPLTAGVSADGGKTWGHVRDIEDDPQREYAYTSVLFVEDRIVLTYYVRDPKTGRLSSRFRSLPVAWVFEKGK